MSSKVFRSRIIPILSKVSKLTGNSKSNIVTRALKDLEPEVASQITERRKSPLRSLMYGLVGGLTGVTAAICYVDRAYTLEEIEKKTAGFRFSICFPAPADASPVEKWRRSVYSALMTTPACAIQDYLNMKKIMGELTRAIYGPRCEKLLPDLDPAEQRAFTLVLDLNQTLVNYDRLDRGNGMFVRPGFGEFLEHMAKLYEIVVYADEHDIYLELICRKLDKNGNIHHRLALGATECNGVDDIFYRDLSRLNRDPAKILYVSGHAFESCFQPENCVPIKPYKLDGDRLETSKRDTTLLDLIPFLEYVAHNSEADVREILASYERKDIAKEFLMRSKEHPGENAGTQASELSLDDAAYTRETNTRVIFL